MKSTLKTLSVLAAAALMAAGALASPILTTNTVKVKQEVLPVCTGIPDKGAATDKPIVAGKIETVAAKNGSMVVTVRDYFGAPLADVLVELDPQHGSPDARSLRTDKNGRAEFGKLRADNWRVVVHFEVGIQWSMIKVEAGRQAQAEFWDTVNPIN